MSSSAAESRAEPQGEPPRDVPPALAGRSATTAEREADGAPASEAAPGRPAAVIKGGTRGLELVIDGRASNDAIATALCTRLAEAPGFFRGSAVRVRVEDGPLAAGCLGRLDDIATRFELRIVEVSAQRKAELEVVAAPALASGSTAVAAGEGGEVSPTAGAAASTSSSNDANASPPAEAAASSSMVEPAAPGAPPVAAAAAPAPTAAQLAQLSEALPAGDTRIVVGPVRSGVILEHTGNLVVVGDVNPGAEVRAERNIIVLGRLRGIAHAGIGRTYGFILALKLEPQQLRIARQVARAGDADGPVAAAEIAYVTSNKIVVERYAGKLPLGLANSM
jgi:septum site-determining protein MinC